MTSPEEYKLLKDSTSEEEVKRERTVGMLRHMLSLQNQSNKSLFPDWQSRNLGWDTAILVESAELVDHLDWKWWKAGSVDKGQAQMEVVDIWHFLLSKLILQEPGLVYLSREDVPEGEMASYFRAWYTLRYIATRVAQSAEAPLEIHTETLTSHVKKFVSATLSDAYQASDAVYYFAQMMSSSGLTFEQLYRKYIGKNVLNAFRWSNGYKEGTYVKDWLGQEDNQYLTEVLLATDEVGTDLEACLSSTLEARYGEVTAATA